MFRHFATSVRPFNQAIIHKSLGAPAMLKNDYENQSTIPMVASKSKAMSHIKRIMTSARSLSSFVNS